MAPVPRHTPAKPNGIKMAKCGRTLAAVPLAMAHAAVMCGSCMISSRGTSTRGTVAPAKVNVPMSLAMRWVLAPVTCALLNCVPIRRSSFAFTATDAHRRRNDKAYLGPERCIAAVGGKTARATAHDRGPASDQECTLHVVEVLAAK